MRLDHRTALERELLVRGFTRELASPHRTMSLDSSWLDNQSLSDLLDMMVARREKLFRMPAVVGEQAARRAYDDVVLVIEAIKLVIEGSL